MKPGRAILLVEDDDIDARTVQRGLKDLGVANPLVRVGNGEEALAWLRDSANQPPGIILLDLNLPMMTGLEFLDVAKADRRLRRIPVVVITSSRLEEDRLASFDHSVAGYMVKPADYGQLLEVLRTIHHYWTTSEAP